MVALVFAQKAYIKKPADFGYAAEEQTNRTWMFGCERLVYVSAPRGAVASITQAEQAILDQINSIQPDFSPL